MAHGRSRDAWLRLSSLMAIIANANRDPKSDPITPDLLDIYDKRGELKRPQDKPSIPLDRMMKALGVKHKPEGVKDGPDS